MYYEAKSVNTQLIYRYKQLERAKETLEAAWLAHERLHRAAAGLDVSDDDVYSSSVFQPTSVRDLSFSHQSASPVRSPHTDDALLLSAPRCPGSPSVTTRQGCAVSDDVHCRDPSWPTATRRGRTQDFNSAASNRTNDSELADCGNDGRKMKHNSDDPTGCHHLTYPTQSSSVLCYTGDVSGHSDVAESESSVFDADQRSTLCANSDDDDGLDSLFGGDDWWVSDESWRWQCGTPASAADETSPTATELESAQSNGCSTSILLGMNDVASSNFRHHDQFIPLHVEALVDDSSYHQHDISDI